jgi:hypothetical protein
MPRGLISNENDIDKIGEGEESICTRRGDVLGPQTPIFEKKHVELSSLFFEPAIFFYECSPYFYFYLLSFWKDSFV